MKYIFDYLNDYFFTVFIRIMNFVYKNHNFRAKNHNNYKL